MTNFKQNKGFKLSGFTPYTKAYAKIDDTPYKKAYDETPMKKKKSVSLMEKLRMLENKLRVAKSAEEKSKIQKRIKKLRNEIEKGFNETSQLNPNNPDKD